MTKTFTFQLDLHGGADLLQLMAMKQVKKSTEAIAARANGMTTSMSSNPPKIETNTEVGMIKKGDRAIGTIYANVENKHEHFVAAEAILKSIDAGKVR